MTERNFERLIAEVVEVVLETMFFSAPWGSAEPETGGSVLESRLAFRGRPSGTFDVCLSEHGARLLAAGFLGEDEEMLTDSQTGEVVCELANMLCGSLVSKLQSDRSFDLGSPRLVPFGSGIAAGSAPPPVARQSFAIEGGTLTVTLNLEASA
jgi:hypothetical protein